jgi:membrane protein implicated in regulation of membrane protease activity
MDASNGWLTPQVIWFAVGFILLVIEFATPGIIIVFFGAGAWIVALVCLFFDIPLNVQLLIFIVSSIVLLVTLRKWLKQIFQLQTSPGESEELKEFIGQRAIVSKEIKPRFKGKVEFHGSYWDAEANQTIGVGEPVEIVDKHNITLIVKPLE